VTTQEVIEEVKFELTGGVLELTVEDKDIETAVYKALRELNRFWDETTMVTVPFSPCIDLSDSELDLKEKVSSIVHVYRTSGYGVGQGTAGMTDPLYAQQWMIFSNGGTMYNLNDYVMNYAAWNTLLQAKNTMSTDMAFEEDKHNNKLYINQASDRPNMVTIKYIPKLFSPEQIKDDYWIDYLVRFSVALTKIVEGRIRTRFGQSNAIWGMDGEKLLEEGNTEYKELRETLRTNANMIYGVD